MSLMGVFDIAGSGMSAQSIRLNTVASNLANVNTVSSSVDRTYKARHPVFQAVFASEMGDGMKQSQLDSGRGVQVLGVLEDQAEPRPQYQPDHPLADENGYIYLPDINAVEEMADMISASRSFQTNVDVMDAAKQMMQRVLTLGQ